jgi:uracil-DNA glycosylase
MQGVRQEMEPSSEDRTMTSSLIEQIAAFDAPNVFNPWRHIDPLDAVLVPEFERRHRLAQHFDCEPEFLLVGEAPGYQGCHFSGVPFTNESLLLSRRVPRIDLQCQRITTREKPWSEPSATIVWNQLHALGIAERTVMWNAFAWHPHKPGELMSNRTPTPAEVRSGSHVLKAVLEHFKGVKVVAVGKVAAAALQRAYVRLTATVRHPSMGGANEFREQMTALVKGQVAA